MFVYAVINERATHKQFVQWDALGKEENEKKIHFKP